MLALATALLATPVTLPGVTTDAAREWRSPIQQATLLPAPRMLAKRRGQRRRRATRQRAATPVVVQSRGNAQVTLTAGRQRQALFVVSQAAPLELKVTGPGRLQLQLYQMLGSAKGGTSPAALVVSIDGKVARNLTLSGRPWRKGKLAGAAADAVGVRATERQRIRSGQHIVVVSTPNARHGAAVRIRYVARGTRRPAPIVIEPAGQPEPVAVEAPPAPAAPPMLTAPSLPAPASEGAAERAATAAPAGDDSGTAAVVATPLATSAGPFTILGDYQKIIVKRADTSDSEALHLVNREESYLIQVPGNGILTVRLFPLLEAGTVEPTSYAVIILENDIVLRQIRRDAVPTSHWRIEADPNHRVLADPKEYRLELAPGGGRLAFQITQAATAMAVSADFEAKKLSLADAYFSLDEPSDDDGSRLPTRKTIVTEVDPQETVVERIVYRDDEDLFGLGVGLRAARPSAGGQPSVGAALDVRFAPLPDRAVALGLQAGFVYHGLPAAGVDPDGRELDSRSVVYHVPILAHVAGRYLVIEGWAITAGLGGGLSSLRLDYRALGQRQSASKLTFGGRAAIGTEIEAGAGWIAVDLAYDYTPRVDLGAFIENYSASGPGLSVNYRLGL